MSLKLQNITHLFKNVRTRTIIIVTALILLLGLLVGVGRLMNKAAPADSSIQLKDPPNLQSIPGGLDQSPSADYQRLQQQQNIQQAALAEKTGDSAIPTLLDTSQFNQSQQNANACCRPCSCCGTNSACSNQIYTPSGTALLQPSQLRSGTLVYDAAGNVVGRLGADGKVRDKQGEIIGQVGPDGLVRAADGSVIGSAAVSASGDPVYDATGHLIGHVGIDGKVRDAQGRVMGTVAPDGTVRDLKGAVIGRVINPQTINSGVGASVYDTQGHLLGTVGSDGKVRDAKGNVVGEVGTDGIVRDATGKIIGKTGVSNVGAPVYDAQGHLLGTVGSDGKVRDAKGNVVGEVGTDGIVRDATGKIIGKTGVSNVGAPVYDAQGHLLGTVGSDGKVRDAKGNVVGEVGTDGIVRDATGKIIGKTGVSNVGAPVYDAQGHLLGTVGADGVVHDAKGNVIGKVGADGFVRDAEGKLVGQAYLKGNSKRAIVIPGMPVYDKQGKLIGTVGANGGVLDSHGKVIGTLDRNGVLHDANNKILGKVGATAPGIPLYDAQGRLIGTVGSDGIVRDSQGRAIATIGADGVARDRQGNSLGSTTAPTVSRTDSNRVSNTTPDSVNLLSGPGNPNPELQAILDRQAQQISAQKAEQLQQQMQSSMSTQASQLFAAWVSPTQQYVAGVPSLSGGVVGGGASGGGSSLAATAPAAVKAGTIMYAVLLTEVNSDEPGPVLAEIVQGKFKGARILGTLSNQGKKVLLSFNTLTLPKLGQSIAINTIAIDENTARTALSSYTNNHYWLRYGTLFASAFLQGYGQSFAAVQPNFVFFNNNTTPDLNPRQRIFVGLGQVGTQYASVLGSVFSTPPTVHVYSGTPMGILFLSDLAALPE